MCLVLEKMEENEEEYKQKSQPVKEPDKTITPEMIRQEQKEQSNNGLTWNQIIINRIPFNPPMVSISGTRYFQIGKQRPDDYLYEIWTRPSRAQRRDVYDASWLEPHTIEEPRPQPPRGHEHL